MIGRRARLRALDDLGLGIRGDDVFAALQPFIAEGPDFGAARHARETALRRKRLWKRLRNRVKAGWSRASGRGIEKVFEEYEATWQDGYAHYDIAAGPRSFTPWLWRGRALLVDGVAAARIRNPMLGAVIAALRPKRVLEVGCGNGINLFLLAGAFPDIAFTGLELTEAGHQAAVALQAEPELPAHLGGYAIVPWTDPRAFKRIAFMRGDATAMPFDSGAFDLVITVLSIEQMERARHAALTEIARVTGGHLLNLEPFRDVNGLLWRRLYVAGRDYFRGSIAALRRYGLEPVWATDDFPQEKFLGTALVLSRKRQPSP